MTLKDLEIILLSEEPSKQIIANEKDIFLLIPELEKCKGFEQNNDWHIYDVYNHILHVVDGVSPNLLLRYAALFHDVGKPLCYQEDENGIGHFYGHYAVSQKIFDDFALKHNIDEKDRETISKLIYYHDYNIDKLSNQIIEIFNLEELDLLYELKYADLYAHSQKKHSLASEYEKQKVKIKSYYKEG